MKKQLVSALLVGAMLSGTLPVQALKDNTSISVPTTATAAVPVAAPVIATPYTGYGTPSFQQYLKQFGVTDIQSYANNGGQYSSSSLNRAFDGNTATHWETGRSNSTTFQNAVTVTFKQVESIGSILYGARPDADNKGFAEKFSVYASRTDSGEDFKLVASGRGATQSGMVQIKFAPTEFKRLRFVFDQANNGWASASELTFLRQDVVLDAIDPVFTNGLMTELTEKYRDKTVLADFISKLEAHPLRDQYTGVLDAARTLLNGQTPDVSGVTKLPQKGNETSERDRTRLTFALYAHEPTGVFLSKGGKLKVYVDADPKGIAPEIVLGSAHFVKLKPGYNDITLPDNMNGPAQVYLANRAYANQQAYAPNVRVVGGTRYPVYIEGKTDPKEFMDFLEQYSANITSDSAAFAGGNPNDLHANMTDISSDNILIQTSALGAVKGLRQQFASTGRYVDYTIETYEDMYREYVQYSGFDYDLDPSRPWNQRPLGKFMIVGSDGGAFGWAQHGFTGYNGGGGKKDSGFWVSLAQAASGWALFHEVGHQYDSVLLGTSESTNNLYSLLMQDKYLEKNRMVQENRWNKDFTAYHNTKVYPNDQLFLGAITYQLELLYGRNIYGDAQRISRENKDNWIAGLNNKERMAVGISRALNVNMLPHYEYFGIKMSDTAKSRVAGLPALDKKTWYINDKVGAKDAIAFPKPDVKPVITATGTGTVTLNVSIDEPANAVLVYEIYRDGQYLGVTYGNRFTDTTATPNTNHAYTVKAYDRKLNVSPESDPIGKNASEPVLSVPEKRVLPLRATFDPLAEVSARDVSGTDLTSHIKVTANNVDTAVKGSYTVTYRVTDANGNFSTKTMAVEVVSAATYLSDLTPANTQGYYKKDVDASGSRISLLTAQGEHECAKGVSAHANTTVTYRLDPDQYQYFEAYAGLDDYVRTRTAASVTFQVWADGTKVYDSGKVRASDVQRHVLVPLAGVSELKLVTTDAGDGNSYDHAMWGDAKLFANDSKPTLTIPADQALKVGETLNNIYGTYSASDVEDGDLTAQVKTSGTVDTNRAGSYTLTYTVTDGDGNTVTKTRTVSVVDTQDFAYATDFDWQSASVGWGSIQKDHSPSGGKIRLTDANGQEVTFARGIGAHASSRVVYDLTDKNASYFTAEVGVDRAMYNTVGSVRFEVYIDGAKVADTGLMNSRDPMQHIEVNLAGGKQLALVATDGGNGNGSDHSVWADAKFLLAKEAKPTLDVTGINGAITALEGSTLNLYTKEYVTEVRQQVAAARALLATDTATQDALNTMTAALTTLLQNPQESAGKKQLADALKSTVSVPEVYSTLAGWTDYQELVIDAKDMYNRPTDTDELPIKLMATMVEQYLEMFRRAL